MVSVSVPSVSRAESLEESDVDFDGRIAVVTGASGGLAIAVALGTAGARVGLVARSHEGLEETQRLIGQPEAKAFCTDLRDEKAIEKLGDSVKAGFGAIDILVHCAGVWHDERTKYHGPRLVETPVETTSRTKPLTHLRQHWPSNCESTISKSTASRLCSWPPTPSGASTPTRCRASNRSNRSTSPNWPCSCFHPVLITSAARSSRCAANTTMADLAKGRPLCRPPRVLANAPRM